MFLGLDGAADEAGDGGCEVLSVAQMREADRLAVAGGVRGYELMISAGQSVAHVVNEHYSGRPVLILCGPGNNGGDGFVAARFLEEAGHEVTVMASVPVRKYKGDARLACRDWGGAVHDFAARPDMPPETVVIDAVFGTGLAKPIGGAVASLFAAIRAARWPVVAVDIPSGVCGDTGRADPATLHAAHTVTFFRKKTGHLMMPGMALCGRVGVYDIGIPRTVLEDTGFTLLEDDPAWWRAALPGLRADGHKYNRGHVVVLGGARMTGAARMASEAAMRMGAGLCTIAAPESAAAVYKRGAAHVLYEPLSQMRDFAASCADPRRNAIVMGPGAGLDDVAGLREAVLDMLALGRPAVLDADALTCFSEEPEALCRALHERCVLTPHEAEFARLFGAGEDAKVSRAVAAAEKAGAVILLKGPDTVIARPGGAPPAVNIHATPWLATAGAGDVLAGMIAGLLAQGMDAFPAACAAAWLHGEAGLRAGPGLVAPDLIAAIPAILRGFS